MESRGTSIYDGEMNSVSFYGRLIGPVCIQNGDSVRERGRASELMGL